MVDLQKTLDFLKWAWDLVSESAQGSMDWVSSPWVAAAAAVIGLILALWGGRVLRVGFVFVFMTAGALLGKRVANSIQIDLLIGLVVGAGAAGAVGYFIYRWCLGVTFAALLALVMAATFSAPTLLNERQAFDDFRLGVGSGQYLTSATPLYSWTAVRGYFWEKPGGREVALKALGPVALTALVGFVVSVLAPRFASVLATSLLGTVLLAAGGALLLAARWPNAWDTVLAHRGWSLAGMAFFLLCSLMYQATHPNRPVVQISAPPAPAPAA